MGSCRNKDSSPMNQALIMATMSLIGLEVDAHLRDCSVYSGIFFNASFENGFSVVLKNARMTEKGNSDSNVAIGELVATLVILSGDLIQVVAKGGQFVSDGEAGNSANKKNLVEKENRTTQGKNVKNDQIKPVEGRKETIAPKLLPSSTSITPVMTVDSKSGQISKPNKTAKESKLNPGAKMFIPTVRKPVAANPTVPMVASGMGYVLNGIPSVGPTMAPPEFYGFSPFRSHSPVPVKVLPYGNLPAAGPVGPTIAQYPQPVVGHLGNRQQPVRVGGPYPIQAGPGILHPNPQPIMVGPPGQVAYFHPAPQEVVQGVPFARPMMTHHQVQFPKHQGQVMQQQHLYMAPYPIAAVPQQQQPYSMPHNIPILQPNFVSNRYAQVPGTNGILNTKFL